MNAAPDAELTEALARENAIDFDRFGHRDAWEVGQWLVATATERDLSIAAEIWLGEQLVFHAALPGTSADNDHWMRRKVGLVRRYDASSWSTKLRMKQWGVTEVTPLVGLDPALHTLSGGAVPIRIHGTSVGVAVVSGLADIDDHELVLEALEHHAG